MSLNINTSSQFRGQRLHLIYSAILPKLSLIEYIRKTIIELSRTSCIIAFIGAANHDPNQHVNCHHTSVIIDFGRVWKCSSYDRFNYDGYQAYWILIKHVSHWKNCINYIAQDPDNHHLISKSEILKEDAITTDDLIALDISMKKRTLSAHKSNDTHIIPFDPELFKWTYKIFELINRRIDPYKGESRTINWFYSDGLSGYNVPYGRWIQQQYDNWLYIDYSGKKNQIIKAVRDHTNWNTSSIEPHGIVIDLSNWYGNDIMFYYEIESILNRRIGRYDIRLNNFVHIVVLANRPPTLDVKDDYGEPHRTLSLDRFNIWEVIGIDCIRHIDRKKLSHRQGYEILGLINVNDGIIEYPINY